MKTKSINSKIQKTIKSIKKQGFLIMCIYPDGEIAYKFLEGTAFQANEEIKYLKRKARYINENIKCTVSNPLNLIFSYR